MSTTEMTLEQLCEVRANLETALNKAIKLGKQRFEELQVHENRQNQFIENGMLSLLNSATQRMKQTMKRSLSADFLLQRKIYTRNLFMLRERIRQMEEDLAELNSQIESMGGGSSTPPEQEASASDLADELLDAVPQMEDSQQDLADDLLAEQEQVPEAS